MRVEIVPEEAATASPPLEVVLRSGDRLVIPIDFDEGTLRRVLGVLCSC